MNIMKRFFDGLPEELKEKAIEFSDAAVAELNTMYAAIREIVWITE